LITFKNILKEANNIKSRGENIFNEIIYKYTGNKSIENRTGIYRRTNKKDKIIFIKPSQYERASMAGYNFCTLLVDNSKYWKEYPKRSRSIICFSGDGKDDGIYDDFGKYLFRVIPKLNAKIAVCPSYDIWYSFNKCLRFIDNFLNEYIETYIEDIDDFNHLLKKVFKLKEKDNFDVIKNKINKYTLSDKQKKFLIKYNFRTLYELIDYYLSPGLNGFQLVNYDNNFKITKNREIWTDADSLLINDNI
jgi:hypothetical protein